MLGHKLWQVLRERFDTWVTVRSGYSAYAHYGLFDPERVIAGVDVFDFDTVIRAVATVQPDVVINAVGVIKQLPTAKDPIVSLTINSLLPHRLAVLCQATRVRLIHISTDCVFSGRKGMYNENDMSDAEDLYGRSKFLGEINGPGCLTLRTSIIGRELGTSSGLVEWFLSKRNERVQGYSRAIYSGFPTLILARIIVEVLEQYPHLTGLYHVSSDPINKYQLLCLLRDAYRVPIEIEPFPDVDIDRSLDSSRFRTVTKFIPLPWPEMIRAMTEDPAPYHEWR